MPAPAFPYPPSPADVPEGLTDYPDSYTRQQNLLLAGLFVFLIFYVGMVVLFAMVGVWCALTLGHLFAVKVVGLVLCGTFFLFLVKGFFKTRPMDKEMHIEVTADEHPALFRFIDRLCGELGAPGPNKVFVAPDVNAMVVTQASLVNLFVEPKKDLLIGLGLVNSTNLSEFKAVLAHEFGHFSQSATASVYTHVASRIIFDLVEGEDWFDRVVTWCKRQENVLKGFGYGVGGCLWAGRQVLWWVLKSITLQSRAVSREREFHADLVAVSAAGSDAATHGLLRAGFGMRCFTQAVDDLATALDHKLYSKDLYLHQDRAAAVVRRKEKEPHLGLPPALKGPADGKKVTVFDAEEEEVENRDDTPPMWRRHPSNADREANAKERFVPAPADHRSPWVLFSEAADLRERMSYKFYRMYFRVPKNTELADPQKVQEYIDNEHADTTYDPKYHGAYDDRPLEPGDLAELDAIVRDSPWAEDRMERVYDKLFDGCREHAEAHAELHKELHALNANVVGKPSPKVRRKVDGVREKLDENREWFKSFDRRVYLLHAQMAAAVDPGLRDELVERYRFQFAVQRLYREARHNQERALAYARALFAMTEVPPEFGADAMQVLRESWRALKKIIQDAREVNLPAMKNFEEGDRLADFILPGKLVPEPPLSYVKLVWCQKLVDQLGSVRARCFRLHFKSVGGILALQEKAAAAWVAARTPVAAEAFDFAAGTAGAVEGDVVDAEALPAAASVDEVRVESLFDDPPGGGADVLPAEVVEPEIVFEVAGPAELEPGPAAPAVAAFTSPLGAAPDLAPAGVAAFAPEGRPESRSEPVAVGELITLDADELPRPAFPAPEAPKTAAADPARPEFGSGVVPAADPGGAPAGVVKPAGGRRPAVRITFVKSGQKSPFAT